MFKSFRRFVSILTAAVVLASAALPAASAFASNSGTLNVVVSPATGIYEVRDDVTGAVVIDQRSGSQAFVIPAGDYRVEFKPIPGYNTPANQSFSLVPGGISTITGIYTDNTASGTLHVTVSPSNGIFEVRDDVTGAVVVTERAGSQSFVIPYGDYVVDFKDLTGYVTPADDHISLTPSQSEHTSNGVWNFPAATGTLTVRVNPANGKYEIRDNVTGVVVATERAGSSAFVLPYGDYIVDFKDIVGYVTPADTAASLNPASPTLTVTGDYVTAATSGTLTVTVSPAAGKYEVRDNVTGTVVVTERTGSSAFTLPFGDYIADFKDIGAGYQTPADQPFSLNLSNPDATIVGTYNTIPTTGSVIVNVTKQDGTPISNGNWMLRSCTGATLATCTVSRSNGNSSATLMDVPAGTYGLLFTTTPGYSGAVVLSLNPQALVAGNTVTFDLQYLEAAQTGSVQINVRDNLGLAVPDGSWSLVGPTPRSGVDTQSVVAAVGSYRVAASIPAGNNRYRSVSVSPSTTQALGNGATLVFNVTYTLAIGSVTVNQAGAIGTVDLVGPSPSTVNTATFTNSSALVGDYTLNVTVPAGFSLVDVRDASDTVLTSPYTQALTDTGTIAYTVNYAPLPTFGTLNVTQVGATGTVDVIGPSPATVTAATYTNAGAGTGDYSLNVTVPAGFTLVDVRDAANNVLAAPYTQTLADAGTIDYVVNYAAAPLMGTVNVTQIGSVGTVDLIGPSPATVTTATYTNAGAGVGDYSLAITVPAGFVLVDVRDTLNNVLAAPYTQTLTNGGTIDYAVNFAPVTTSGTINVTQVGAIGTVDLIGPSVANITTATYTNNAAGTGDYTLAITVPAGFNLVDVRDASNAVIAAPYTQTLADGGTIDFTVNYAPVTTSGTVNVNQVGAIGTVDLVGPSAATVTTATYTNNVAGTGDYTLAITVPAGFNLVDVRDAANNVLAAPYTQTLATGGTIDYTVNYVAVTTSGTVNVNQVGATGTVNLVGPSAATVTTATYTNALAGTGSYTLAITAPAGFALVDVRDASNAVLTFPYTQTLANGGTIDFNVNYAPITTSGTINVTQVGATGIVDLVGPSAAHITTATYTNALSGTGSYTLAVTVPAGFVLVDVRDASNTAISAPYTQTLAVGGTIGYTVNYAVAATGTINVNQVGATGTVDIIGPSPAANIVTPYSNASAAAGTYTLVVTVPAGFNLVDVRDGANAALAFPYSQTLVAGGTIGYTVNYAAVTTSGTINVNQVGTTGTVDLLGPSAAHITTATYTNALAGTGTYTLNIAVPLGFVLVDVRDSTNAVIAAPYTQTLATGATIGYTVNYAPAATGTINVTQVGATGTVDLIGPSPATIATTPYSNATATAGSYTLAVTVPAGFVLVDVRDAANAVIAAPYTQTLAVGGTIGYTVNYAAVTTSGTVNVAQIGATGTVDLLGPSPAHVITATYTNALAGTGTYTLAVTVPAGFNLVDVRNASNAVIAAPYTQTLATGATIGYTVNYSAIALPDPAITGFALTAASANPIPGATITYQIDYGNLSGADTVGGVTLDVNYDETHGTVILPAGCVDNTPVAGTMRCAVADLAIGDTGTLTFGYTINAGTALGAILNQSATITAANGNSNVANDTRAVATTVLGAFTLTKTASTGAVNDNGVLTYTIRLVRNTSQAGPINVTLNDTVTGTSLINGTAGGSMEYILNMGTCTGVTCSAQQLNLAPITVTLDNPGSTAVVTYQTRAHTSGAAAGSLATNTVTATPVGFTAQTATASVVLIAPGSPVGPSGSSGSGTYGGGGGYKTLKGEMKLDIQKLVSLDGVNFVQASGTKSLAIAVPENKATRLYTKVLIQDLGVVSATNIQFRHFFDSGKSDMTADGLENLVGAHVNSQNLLVVDKVKVGETVTMTYSILVHENGSNVNPAVDGLELVSYGSALPSMQDGLTYLGLGSQTKTYLYAGKVPANAEQDMGTTPSTDTNPSTDTSGIPDVLALDVHANKPIANVGDTITFVATLRNLSNEDLTNVFVDHEFDADAFEVADTFGARFDGNTIHWKQPLLRPGQQVTLSFNLKVKDSAPVGATVHGLTRVLVSEFEGIAPFENMIRIGAAGQTMQLAQTGPAGILGLLLALSALVAFAHSFLRRAWHLRNRRLALQSI